MSLAVAPTGPRRLHHREEVMGTVITFDAYLASDRPAPDESGVAEAVAELHRIDRLFSTWRADSPLSRLRRGDESLGEVPPEVHDVLDACRVARRLSGRWFDPWRMPGGVDPTGYVKGWAAQRALERFLRPGMLGAIVNAAGDVATWGQPAPGEEFRLGVTDPRDPTRLASVVISPGAVATSGDYERAGQLVDPFSAVAHTRVASATVSGNDLGLCDALATGLCVGGAGALGALAHLAGYEALLIGFDGTGLWTPAFPFALDSPRLALTGSGSRVEATSPRPRHWVSTTGS